MITAPRSFPVRLVSAGVGLAAALLLAGCSPSGPRSGTGVVTVTTTPSATAPSTDADSVSPAGPATTSSSPATSSGGGGVTRCDAADLRGTIGGSEGAAGSTVVDLELQNTGGGPCTLQGWPGVSAVTSTGTQIGAAADFDRSSAHATVTLQPNGHAHASLKIAQATNFSSAQCDPTTTSRLRVYPPGSRDSIIITNRTFTACSSPSVHLLTVQALHATT